MSFFFVGAKSIALTPVPQLVLNLKGLRDKSTGAEFEQSKHGQNDADHFAWHGSYSVG